MIQRRILQGYGKMHPSRRTKIKEKASQNKHTDNIKEQPNVSTTFIVASIKKYLALFVYTGIRT